MELCKRYNRMIDPYRCTSEELKEYSLLKEDVHRIKESIESDIGGLYKLRNLRLLREAEQRLREFEEGRLTPNPMPIPPPNRVERETPSKGKRGIAGKLIYEAFNRGISGVQEVRDRFRMRT